MTPENRRVRPTHCPICGTAPLQERWIDERFYFVDGEDRYLIESKNVPLEDCLGCGESFSGPEAARIRHDSLGRALGLLPPEEIARIRNVMNLSLDEFADKLGVATKTIDRWERGRLWQGREFDRLIRSYDQDRRDLEVTRGRSAPSHENGSTGD